MASVPLAVNEEDSFKEFPSRFYGSAHVFLRYPYGSTCAGMGYLQSLLLCVSCNVILLVELVLDYPVTQIDITSSKIRVL